MLKILFVIAKAETSIKQNELEKRTLFWWYAWFENKIKTSFVN